MFKNIIDDTTLGWNLKFHKKNWHLQIVISSILRIKI